MCILTALLMLTDRRSVEHDCHLCQYPPNHKHSDWEVHLERRALKHTACDEEDDGDVTGPSRNVNESGEKNGEQDTSTLR